MKKIPTTLLLISASLFAKFNFITEKPKSLEQLYHNYMQNVLIIAPESGAGMGLTKEMGFHYDTTAVNYDYDEEELKEGQVLKGSYLDLLEPFKKDKLSPADEINREVFKEMVTTKPQDLKFYDHSYGTTTMDGLGSAIIDLFTNKHPIRNLRDAESFMEKLNKIPFKIERHIEMNKRKESKNILPPKQIVQAVIIQNENWCTTVKEQPIYISFKEKLDNLKGVSDLEKDQMCSKVATTMEKTIYPAYQNYLDYLTALSARTDSTAGVWKLPDGDEYYRYCLKGYGIELKPEEIHQIGLREVAKCQEELLKLFKNVGIESLPTDDCFYQIVNRWSVEHIYEDTLNYRPNTPEGKKQVYQDYLKIIKDAESLYPTYTAVIPHGKVDLKSPDFPSPSAYYSPGSLDGTRDGIFYINLQRNPPHMKTMQTLTYHETVPGHHLQVGIDLDIRKKYPFRSSYCPTIFAEGWAHYAESLADELGWYQSDDAKIDYWLSQLHRSVRLVSDTGIHHKRWTRQQAYDYIKQNLGWGGGEVDRQSVWPGQALTYKLGQLKIFELREKVKAKQQDKFDLKEFHTVVLQNGSVSLKLLEEIVKKHYDL